LLGNQLLDLKVKLPFKISKYLVIIVEDCLCFSSQAQILKREVPLFMNVSIVILWYLGRRIIRVISHEPFGITLLLLWWSLALGVVVMEMLLLLSSLGHYLIWSCLSHGVFIFEDDWYASSFSLECLIQPTLGIKLNIQIAICGIGGVWW
jgi:hypothetical protein